MQKTAALASEVAAPSDIPTGNDESPRHSTISPASGAGAPDAGHSNRCAAEPPGFNLRDSKDMDCGASFHTLRAICISSLVRFYFLKNILENFVNLGLKTLK